jgi:lipopolysaccharide/colanic/teichoic acid biosynthesis glycosyltransferase
LGGSITGRNDPRVTRVGAILRRTKLDELPQFLNLLCGDMTLVGPRPETPDIVELYTPAQREVLAVKPGITGPVQLECAAETESLPEGDSVVDHYLRHVMDAKIRRDIEYLKSRTPASEVRVIAATAFFVMRSFIRRQKRCDFERDSGWRKAGA